MSYQRAEQPVVLKGVEAAKAFFAPCMAGARAGEWWVAHVDEQVRCLHLAGYAAETEELPVGMILDDAARLGSAGILMASRDGVNGRKGVEEARRMAGAAEALDMTLIDHLLFRSDDCVSLRRSGLL